METELVKKLLEAGVHFGHQTRRWNPKMKSFIFGERKGIYIIDLEQTAANLKAAVSFIEDVAAQGECILFVGTKRQAQEIIKFEALRSDMFYVNRRWLGGMLTNFQTITKSIDRLKELIRMKEDGTFDALSKKEVSMRNKEMEKLNKNFSGILNMGRLPGALFVIDSYKEETTVREANKLAIPVVGLIDTNCDPRKIDYVIPGNDDGLKSIKLVASFIADAIIEGRKKFAKAETKLKQETEKEEVAEEKAEVEEAKEAEKESKS